MWPLSHYEGSYLIKKPICSTELSFENPRVKPSPVRTAVRGMNKPVISKLEEASDKELFE